MKKGIFVEDITKENMEVDSSFIVIKKTIFTSKNNTKYMSLELKDKTGKIEGKIWDNVDLFDNVFEKNDIVSIKAKTRFFQDKPQLHISNIKKVDKTIDIDGMRNFFPESERGIEHLKE